MAPDVLEKPDTTVASTDMGDHEKLSHYVSKTAWERAYVFGDTVTALCGKKWKPSSNPERHPVCPECQEALDAIPE